MSETWKPVPAWEGLYEVSDLGRVRPGRLAQEAVHRLVLLAFVGVPDAAMVGCHNDGDPLNNALSNLRWDTQSGNRRDQFKHGTEPSLSRTHCIRGHELSADNLVAANLRQGGRTCLTCHRDRARARRAVSL